MRTLRRVVQPVSLRGRVTWVVLLLLTVALVLVFLVVDVALSARLHADARTRLTDRVGLARQLDGDLTAQQLVDRLRGDGVTAEVCQADGSSCVAADPSPRPPGNAGGPGGAGGTRGAGAAADRPTPPGTDVPVETAGSVLFVRTGLEGDQVLTLSLDTTQITDAVNRLVVLEVFGGIVALSLAGVGASRLARTALRPLEEMTVTARRIAAGEVGRRIAAGAGAADSELGRTAAAFDAMLEELEAAAAASRAAETRMRTFLGDASHELRTPLAGLQAGAEQLILEDPDRDERERIALGMVRETRRAARLVDDLLTMARLGEGMQLVRQPVDLVPLVAGEVARARALSPELTFTVPPETACVVDGDPGRLAQIVTNLLDNARQVTPAGGAVHVTLARDRHVELRVADTGPGVSEADRARIFERLGRGDASRSRHTGGAGLGLPIARGLARAHGGDLTLDPTPLPGATFRLTLPAGAALL